MTGSVTQNRVDKVNLHRHVVVCRSKINPFPARWNAFSDSYEIERIHIVMDDEVVQTETLVNLRQRVVCINYHPLPVFISSTAYYLELFPPARCFAF